MKESSLKIASGVPVLGTWISIGAPVITELASSLGFDWLLFDLEHGCYTEADILPNLQAVRGHQTANIVRTPSAEPSLIARMLDRGADGIMVPHVTSAALAESIVAATRHAPRGARGYSRTVRAYDYGLSVPDEVDAARCLVLVQIEDFPSVECAEEIAAVDGVDILFVGPADLTHDLTTRGLAARYDECLRKVARACQSHGKQAGILVRNPADIPFLKELGYTVLAADSDLGLLRKGYTETLKHRT